MTKPKCSLSNKKTSKKSKTSVLHDLVKKASDGDHEAIEKLEQVIRQDPDKKALVKKLSENYKV